MGHELAEENRAQHAWQDERLLVFVEHLIALDFDAATAELDRFVTLLEAHMAFEEAHAMPALTRLVESGALGIDALVIKQIDGDHTILTRTLGRVREALDKVRAAGTKRALILELDTFLLLRRVLEHHTARELRDLYPALDAHLPEDERVRTLEALHAVRAAME